MKAGAVEPRVNNTVKFPYSLGPTLRGGYKLNNCYYLLNKCFAEV